MGYGQEVLCVCVGGGEGGQTGGVFMKIEQQEEGSNQVIYFSYCFSNSPAN